MAQCKQLFLLHKKIAQGRLSYSEMFISTLKDDMGKCSVKAKIKSTIIKPDGLRLRVAGHDNHLCNCFSLRKNTARYQEVC